MEHTFFKVVSTAWLLEVYNRLPTIHGQQDCPLAQAHGRVLATDIYAPEDSPPFTRSSMDGYALLAQDSFGSSESNPGYLECIAEIAIDRLPDFALQPGQCASIVTGAGLPQGANSVIMVEHTQDIGSGTIELRKSVAPGENIMLRAEDVAQEELVLTAGSRLRPQDIGILAALGISQIPVRPRLEVAIISTGDEIIDVQARPQPGQIRDVNRFTLAALVEQAGGKVVYTQRVPDDLDQIGQTLNQALDCCDLCLISGGSSIGVRDHTMTALEGLPDSEVLAHGIAMSPGKPTLLARSSKGLVLGLPGQITSAQMVMKVLGLPLLRHLQGEDLSKEAVGPRVQARLSRNIASKQGREDYVRVRLEPGSKDAPQATPLLGKSGLLKTLLLADGVLRIPADVEGLTKGQQVRVRIF